MLFARLFSVVLPKIITIIPSHFVQCPMVIPSDLPGSVFCSCQVVHEKIVEYIYQMVKKKDLLKKTKQKKNTHPHT